MSIYDPKTLKFIDKELADLYSDMDVMSSAMYDSLYYRNKKDYALFGKKYTTVKQLYKKIGIRMKEITEISQNPDRPLEDED